LWNASYLQREITLKYAKVFHLVTDVHVGVVASLEYRFNMTKEKAGTSMETSPAGPVSNNSSLALLHQHMAGGSFSSQNIIITSFCVF
jgi:hypothetical protein